MKCTWLGLALVIFLQTVSCQEDLAEGEVKEETTRDDSETPGEEGPPQPPFVPPAKPSGDVYFAESFSDVDEVWKVWVKSAATKEDADAEVEKYNGKWKIEALSTEGASDEDEGLVLSEAAKHYAIAAKLDRPFTFDNADAFVVQYEVNFQNGLTCGGAYIKLLTGDVNLQLFHDKTPYSIMFGPDKCGMTSKIHFIVQFENPVTGEIEEKHSKHSTDNMGFFDDKKTHLFTLLIRSDGIYHIIVDQKPFLKGNLLEDMTPPIVPPQEIDDPDDKMPENWDEREKIPDPEAVKPDDWDEDAPAKIQDPDAVKPDGWLDEGPEYITDPDATMPEDWDEEEDGEYEPPMIANPACEEVGCGTWKPPMIQNPNYKGKWKPPLIDNPDYDGKWSPRKIDNPAYFVDEAPFFNFMPISALGFELWSMSEDIYFDNIIVCGELAIANNYAREGWVLKMERERTLGGGMSISSWMDSFIELANTYPYLWALYAIALVLPFVCCIGFCCVRSSKDDETASRKKTDAPSPDDPHEEEKEADPRPAGSKDDEQSFVAPADEQEEEEVRQTQDEEGGQDEGEERGSQEREDGENQEREDGENQEREDGESQEREDGESQEREDGENQEREDGESQEREDGESQGEDEESQGEDGDGQEEDKPPVGATNKSRYSSHCLETTPNNDVIMDVGVEGRFVVKINP